MSVPLLRPLSLLLVLRGVSSASVSAIERRPPPPPSRSPPPRVSLLATEMDEGEPRLAGIASTLEEGEVVTAIRSTFEEDEVSCGEGDETRLGLLARLYFDEACLVALPVNGSGTTLACPVGAADAYVEQLYRGLRADRLVGVALSAIVLFSASQLGGVPYPNKPLGMACWALWMLVQLLQYVLAVLSLASVVFAFLSVRNAVGTCAIPWAYGISLLDAHALATFALQPAVVGELVMEVRLDPDCTLVDVRLHSD